MSYVSSHVSSHVSSRGQDRSALDDDNTVSIDQQEAALVWELRRLQRFLDEERDQQRFTHAIDLQREDRPPKRPRARQRPPAKQPDSKVERLLDRLGFNRRKPAARPRPLSDPPAKRPVHHEAKVLVHPASDHGRPPHTHKPPELARITAQDRIAGSAPVERKDAVRSALVVGQELVRSHLTWESLRTGCAFLVGRAPPLALDGPEPTLTRRLMRAFEGELRIGLRVLIIGVGIVGGWACLVPLSGAVVVPGTLVVESDVKKIQHPAGGVVANIPVRDGMHVSAGDTLLRLDETQLRANAQVLTQQLDQTRVRLARLMAERDGLEQPQMPHDMAGRTGDSDLSRLWASEISLFNSRTATRRNAKDLLQSRIGQLGEQISGLDAQVKSKAAQHDLISGELEGVDGLFQKGLVPLTRKTSLQREAARLDGERGQVVASIAEAKSKISEAELQVVKVDHDFRTEVMKDLREAQDKEAELVEKSTAAQDLLRRIDLRAPNNGIIHQLSVHTIGGVITPGEVVMEIVPESDELQIEARLPPQEVDHVRNGQRAYIRLSAFNQRTTPQLEGVVSYLSADLNHDRQKNPNAAPYYTVRVTLPPSERRRLGGLELVSGMPVEVFLQTGSRTMMSYLLKPITDQLLRTFN